MKTIVVIASVLSLGLLSIAYSSENTATRNLGAVAGVQPLVINQPREAPPALSSERPFDEIIHVEGAPCMVMEAGKCRIRANHIEVR
jgi:hypothetical protein